MLHWLLADKFQAPNSKQIPNSKHQIPNKFKTSKPQNLKTSKLVKTRFRHRLRNNHFHRQQPPGEPGLVESREIGDWENITPGIGAP